MGAGCRPSPVDGWRSAAGLTKSGVPRAERLGSSVDGGCSLWAESPTGAAIGCVVASCLLSALSAAGPGGATFATGVFVEEEEVEEGSTAKPLPRLVDILDTAARSRDTSVS